MAAYAKCLWIAGTLPAPGRTPLTMGTANPGLCSVSCRDDESPEAAPQRGPSISRQGHGKRLPAGRRTLVPALNPSPRDLCAVASSEPVSAVSIPFNVSRVLRARITDGADPERVEGMPATSTGCPLCKTLGRSQSRSLSYLSLTLCCAALHSGWLKGCVTPSSKRGTASDLATHKGIENRSDEGRRKRQRHVRSASPRLSSKTMNRTGIILP
jgi:hypothetical protein